MFVDLWIVSLFSLLFGFCAVFNYKLGVRRGIEGTLVVLQNEKIIKVNGESVVTYRKDDQ